MKYLSFLVTILVCLQSAVSFSDRVTYDDLPLKKGTSKQWVTGSIAEVPICFSDFRGYRDLQEEQASLILKSSNIFKKNIDLEASFTAYPALVDPAAYNDSKIKKMKYKKYMKTNGKDIPKCWIASFTVPLGLKSSDNYHIQLRRRRRWLGYRNYETSEKFTIVSANDIPSLPHMS